LSLSVHGALRIEEHHRQYVLLPNTVVERVALSMSNPDERARHNWTKVSPILWYESTQTTYVEDGLNLRPLCYAEVTRRVL